MKRRVEFGLWIKGIGERILQREDERDTKLAGPVPLHYPAAFVLQDSEAGISTPDQIETILKFAVLASRNIFRQFIEEEDIRVNLGDIDPLSVSKNGFATEFKIGPKLAKEITGIGNAGESVVNDRFLRALALYRRFEGNLGAHLVGKTLRGEGRRHEITPEGIAQAYEDWYLEAYKLIKREHSSKGLIFELEP